MNIKTTSHFPSTHGILDLYGVDAALLADPTEIRHALFQAAQAAQATILNEHFHHFGENQGVTGVLLLAESHLSIHTWPEHQYAAVDIFLCGQLKLAAAYESLCQFFQPCTHRWQIIERGSR